MPIPDAILLVEDDPACAAAMRAVFRRSAHETRLIVAETLAEGIALADSAAVTILDLTLLDSTREQTLESIPILREAAPVIVLTGSLFAGETSAQTIERALRLGADAVLFKPFDVSELLSAVLAARINPRPCHAPSEAARQQA